MPTARPIMRASSGAELDTSVKADSPVMPPVTIPTPMIALSRGMPAAMSDPKVMSSTTPAKMTPNTSVMVMPKLLSENTWPPKATVIPAFSPIFAVALRASSCAVVTFEAPSVNWICDRAYCLSALIEFPAYCEYGVTTESMPGSFAIAASIFSIAAV